MAWREIELGSVATFINGYAFKPKDWENMGLPIIRIQNLTNTNSKYNYYSGEYDTKYEVNYGDILISWSASLGVFQWRGEKALLNQHIFKVVFDKIDIDKVYFRYVVSQAIREMEKYTHGSTMKHITKRFFDKIKIPLPPLETQKKIADVLDKAQELIDKRKEQLEKLDEFVQSVFLDMFGDPVRNSKGWITTKLDTLGDWQSGGTPSRSCPKYFEGNIPWYSSGELETMFICESREHISTEALKESAAKMIEPGSLLLGMYDTAALKSSITTCESSCNQAIAFAKLNSEVCNTIFVYSTIQIARDHYRRLQRGVRQKNLNLSMIKEIEIILPSIELQNKFAQIVEKIEQQKQLMQQSLTEMKNNFNSLMQRAFRGELF